ncbi:unnamed protein product [Adineta ricciae]|uniref:BPTI/Kunitz inhibitor domain-containing protein n=1 Tax=Adineta ricciae TaxID=249248 RepID=A0A813RSZ5_ADIRI|nr:unnamed protein product [Adineta ricciae]CAF0797562.1 unnamed protein product [Adineta ricciae]
MFRLLSLITLSIVLFYTIGSTLAAERFVTGKITHDGVNHIEKNSKVEVRLQDISLMDAAAKVIALVTITQATEFPIPFKIEYNSAEIKSHRSYSVAVRINGPNNQLQFINDMNIRVDLTKPSPTADVPVIRIGKAPNMVSSKTKDKKVCGPVKCPGKSRVCPYGFQKLDGCEICKCHDPCNPPGKPILCGPHQRCFVQKNANGTFGTRCDTVAKKHTKKITDPKVVCKQPSVTGPCKAYFKRFYYNSSKKSCENFAYGGCAGNENNFATKAECEKTCKLQ